MGDAPASVATFEHVGGGRDYYDCALPSGRVVLPDRLQLTNLWEILYDTFRRATFKGSFGLRSRTGTARCARRRAERTDVPSNIPAW